VFAQIGMLAFEGISNSRQPTTIARRGVGRTIKVGLIRWKVFEGGNLDGSRRTPVETPSFLFV